MNVVSPLAQGLRPSPYQALMAPSRWRARTLAIIGHRLFRFEQELRAGCPRHLTIPMPHKAMDELDLHQLGDAIRELLELVLLEDVRVDFEPAVEQLSPFEDDGPTQNLICLFSGGADSLAGILYVLDRTSEVTACFCSHSDQSKLPSIIDRLDELLLAPNRVPLVRLPCPPIGTGGFAHLRGFLYFALASAWAALSGFENVVISEVGTTMYQPRLAPLDSVTMTTHPYVIDGIVAISNIVLGEPVAFYMPFANMTKAEVLAGIEMPELLPLTHSCISQRFGNHDGTCFGCVTRRLASLAARVPDVEYQRDPLTDSAANQGNLAPLLDFSLELLSSPREMPWYRKENLVLFDQFDLFERMALDCFLGLSHLQQDGKGLSDVAAHYWLRFVQSGNGDRLLTRKADLTERGKLAGGKA